MFNYRVVFSLYSFWSIVIARERLLDSAYIEQAVSQEDVGEPLYLTPHITAGNVTYGRQLSLVDALPGTQQQSYAGFLTVNAVYNSNLYFWFFPSQNEPSTDPLLLWLNGGPGQTSLFGLFVENGPYTIDSNYQLYDKSVNWNKNHSMLYVDNPVGAGFSFTDDDRGYATNEEDVANGLYSAMTQFFQLFPEYAANEFYITGESYAGKYIPAFANKIFMTTTNTINLKGVAIGDGFIDPITMLPEYADYLFQHGLLDESQSLYMSELATATQALIAAGELEAAASSWDAMLNYFLEVSGLHNAYNYLQDRIPKGESYFVDFVEKAAVRRAIHVGNLTFDSMSWNAFDYLIGDIMQSQVENLAAVMNNYKTLLYNGQLDVIVALPLTEAMLRGMQWHGAYEYMKADRVVWRINNSSNVAGYVRTVNEFHQIVVRNAGHNVPYNQPEAAFDMILRFTSGTGFQ